MANCSVKQGCQIWPGHWGISLFSHPCWKFCFSQTSFCLTQKRQRAQQCYSSVISDGKPKDLGSEHRRALVIPITSRAGMQQAASVCRSVYPGLQPPVSMGLGSWQGCPGQKCQKGEYCSLSLLRFCQADQCFSGTQIFHFLRLVHPEHGWLCSKVPPSLGK